jgi:hypothetical protein
MNEKLLQFIWQFQYFNRQSLHTTEGEVVVIEKPGQWNHHQGPDFSEAIIRIGLTKWVGNVELHIRSSDWARHHHGTDARYGTIILHVVWEDDQPLQADTGVLVPTLELQHRIPGLLLERYRQMMETLVTVPCHAFLPALDQLGWTAWKERLAAERLERRATHIMELLQQSGQHWEEVLWWMIAANFGIRVNATLFGAVAKSLPTALLGKHRQQIHQLEALLLGQANLLDGQYEEPYPVMLQREYRFLKKKYKLDPVHQQPAFLRMRPAAFPTIRLAQLAMLLYRTTGLFAIVKDATDPKKLVDQFMVTANDYWHYHYRFDEETVAMPKQLGKQMAENIMINTVIPVLFAYGLYTGNELHRERAVQWLYQLPAEHNQLTRGWQQSHVQHTTALDSQALIELTNHYCINRRCLECAVGNKILRNGV